MLFYYGRYSHVVRGKRRRSQPHPAAADEARLHLAEEPTLSPARKAALRRRGRILSVGCTKSTLSFVSARRPTPSDRLHYRASYYRKGSRASRQARPTFTSSASFSAGLGTFEPLPRGEITLFVCLFKGLWGSFSTRLVLVPAYGANFFDHRLSFSDAAIGRNTSAEVASVRSRRYRTSHGNLVQFFGA